MKVLKKNQVIIYVIAIMIMTAGYLNYTTNISNEIVKTNVDTESSETGKVDVNNESDNYVKKEKESAEIGDATLVSSKDVIIKGEEEYFIKGKIERDKMFSEMVEAYEKILNSDNSLETQKQVATQEIQKINETKNTIMICENLLKNKQFDENLILVNKDSINVIIGKKELLKEEIAQIQNIISREFKVEISNIHISKR